MINISSSWFTVVLAVATILMSQILMLVIDRPVNAYRQSRLTKSFNLEKYEK